MELASNSRAKKTFFISYSNISSPGENNNKGEIEEYHNQWGAIIDDIIDMSESKQLQSNLLFWYAVILMMRFFKSFQGQPRLAQISKTMATALTDIVHWLIIFVVIFLNFSIGGHILFGSTLREWSTLWYAINTTFKALMGDFDFSAMYDVAPLTASIWFWSFMIVTVFILLNLLMAIIFDHYMILKDKCGTTMGLGTQIAMWYQETEWNFDWYLQRRHYVKIGVLDRKEARGKVKNIEELYEDFEIEAGQGLQYARKTILEQKIERREAEREAFEKRGVATGGSSPGGKNGGKRNSDLMSRKERRASLTSGRGSVDDAFAGSDTGSFKVDAGGNRRKSSDQLEKERMWDLSDPTLSKNDSIRELVDAEDLEDMGMEARFARHLLVGCQHHLKAETDYQETRKNEMQALVTTSEKNIASVDEKCGHLEETLNTVMKGVLENCTELEMAVHETLAEMVQTQSRVGIMPVKGGAQTAFVAPGAVTGQGFRQTGGGSPGSPNGKSGTQKLQSSMTKVGTHSKKNVEIQVSLLPYEKHCSHITI